MEMDQRDVQWLGNEDANLGPAARAALGILLERDDWTWWDTPSKTLASLQRAVPRQSPVKWGGDSSVMDADQWVDPQLAVTLGEAFNVLLRDRAPKIKIVRSVWGWPEGAEAIGVAVAEMSRLVGSGYVFPEWERDVRPRFPVVPRSRGGLIVVTDPGLLPYAYIDYELGDFEWSLDFTVADVLIVDSIEAIRVTKAARLVVLYGQRVGTMAADVSRLRDELCAQCVVHIDVDNFRVIDWLRSVISALVEKGASFAEAVRAAGKETDLFAVVLSSTQSFLAGRYSLFGGPDSVDRRISNTDYPDVVEQSLPYQVTDFLLTDSTLSKSGRAAARVTSDPPTPRELSLDHVARPPVRRPAPPVERILNARTRQGRQEVREWPKAGVVEIDIDIRVRTPLRDSDSRPAFPDNRVEWSEESKLLQVHLFEYGREPESRLLELSRTGDSTTATFTRYIESGSIDLRFLISDGAQILQTARYQTAPGKSIRFFIENIVTPVDRTKKAFDAALLVNDSLGNQPSVAVVTGAGEVVFSPLSENDIGMARQHLLDALEAAVSNPNAELAPLMLKLANRGAMLQSHLRSIVPAWPGSEGRVQLVMQSDAFFPIEYLYDGKIPRSPQAVLCTERAQCLSKGQAIAGCSIRDAGKQLCPMGFLGVSGVIERHTWKTGLVPRVWGTPEGKKPERRRIEDLSTIAFAASDKADNFADADVLPHEIVRIVGIETSIGARRIIDWDDWEIRLAQVPPSLLLLLVHQENEVLYIGAGSGLNLGSIGAEHVRNAPVVIAIGCSSGLGEMPGSSLPAILQRGGAGVVVAAMTKILGRHANRVARDLVVHLKEAANQSNSPCIGEIISAIRRRLLADGLALGLAVIAFGDADIVLGKELFQGIDHVSC